VLAAFGGISRRAVAVFACVGLLGVPGVSRAAADPPRAMSPDPLAFVAPSRAFDTIHIALNLDVDLVGQRIDGSVAHTIRSLRDGVDTIAFNCVGLEIDSVRVDGRDAAFDYPVPAAQSTSWIEFETEPTAGDQLVVHCDPPLARGDEVTVVIRYHGAPKIGLYWVKPEKGIPEKRYEVWSQGEGEDNRYWIPCHDYPDDKATFEGRFTVPKGYTAISNGILVRKQDVGDKTEFLYRLQQPQVSYLIMLAVAKYRIYEDKYNDLPLWYVVPPDKDDATILRGYGLTPDMVGFFAKKTGIDYPYAKYAQISVQNFIYGGMENTSATVMNMRTMHDASDELTRGDQNLISHELAHQWWGDMLTCREWSEMWLNEGFATYYAYLYMEHHDGDDAFRYQMRDAHNDVIKADNNEPRPMVVDFFNRQDARNSSLVYVKGASLLHMLRFLLGDKIYDQTIHNYGTDNKFKTVDTRDLMRAVRETSGENLDWFFEQWAYLAGHPVFKVSKAWDATHSVLALHVEQTQKVGGLVPVFRVPVDVELTWDGGSRTQRIVVESATQDYYFPLPAEPKMVIFDKGDWILKELDFPKTTAELLYQLEHGDFMSRVRAAEALGDKGSDSRTVPALRAVLMADGFYGLRGDAALSLGRVGTDDARNALIEGLDGADAKVRLACAEALGDFYRDERAASALARHAGSDAAWGVRAQAISGLVKMRAADASKTCVSALKPESERSIVRDAALKGLADLGDPAVIDRIKPYCTPGNRRDHRHTAIAAYAGLAKSLPKDSDRTRAADFLVPFLDDWFLRTREATIDALATIGAPSAVSDLRRVADSDPVAEVRDRARKAADRIVAADAIATGKTDTAADLDDLKRRVADLEHQMKETRKATAAKASVEAGGQ
jgi:aminopeptidase N